MNIYYTLKNYKENYTNELNHFINDYEDNDEVDFWDEQRTLYQHCVKNVNIYYSQEFDEYRTIQSITGENYIDEVYNKIIKTVNSNVIEYDFELAEKLKKSFTKILNFIENINNSDIEEVEENVINKQLNDIRFNDYSNYEYTKLLKELSNNYELDLLQSLLSDIEFYLFIEKEEKKSEYTTDDINNAVQRLKEKNLDIPYYKRTPFKKLTEKGKKDMEKLESKGFSFEPTIDLENLLFPYEFYNIYRFIKLIKSKLEPVTSTIQPQLKQNKSLMFEGSNLNLSERFKIANEVLGIDKKIRTLNIQDLEKYQLLAYILGCDKDNARNLMNGQYKAKERDLNPYFNELGLNK